MNLRKKLREELWPLCTPCGLVELLGGQLKWGPAALSRHLLAIWRGPFSATCHGPLRTGGLCPHRYWHRSLNPRKLIEVKFSHLSRNMTMQRTMKLYRLPEASGAPGPGQEREGGRPGEPGPGAGGSLTRKAAQPIVSGSLAFAFLSFSYP